MEEEIIGAVEERIAAAQAAAQEEARAARAEAQAEVQAAAAERGRRTDTDTGGNTDTDTGGDAESDTGAEDDTAGEDGTGSDSDPSTDPSEDDTGDTPDSEPVEDEDTGSSGSSGGIYGTNYLPFADPDVSVEGSVQADVYEGGALNDQFMGLGGDDQISGGAGDDNLFGGSGNDTLLGGEGHDYMNGGEGDDILEGGDGDDLIYMGEGNDVVDAGAGDDILLSMSWGGEPVPAAGEEFQFEDDEPIEDYDVMTGGSGADTFIFRWLIDGTDEVVERNTDETGDVDYSMMGLAGENEEVHDHWVETTDTDVVTDFNAEEGDQLIFEGHTVTLASLELTDWNNDGDIDTVLHFISYNGSGTHDGDDIGTVVLLGAELTEADIVIDTDVFYGVDDPMSSLG